MADKLRIGIIGFDTSHVPAFTRLLNDDNDPHHVAGGKVVVGYPSFSRDIASSYSRVEGFTNEMADKWGVKLAKSIEEVVAEVDAVLLESVDGRRHLEEVGPVIAAGNPVYVDKPLAADYAEAAEIVSLANEAGCPLFSSSSLRFDANIQAVLTNPDLGQIHGCDAFSPATLDPSNPGLFWYGVHGAETLYTFMGPGCEKVRCTSTDKYDVVVGTWPDQRTGVLRGTRCGKHEYGATVYGEGGVFQTLYSREVPLYSGLLKQVMAFFAGASAPVPLNETLEIMAFMQAALVSQQKGHEVNLSEIQA